MMTNQQPEPQPNEVLKKEPVSLGGAVSETLDRLEVLAGKIGMNTPERALELLRGMDEAQEKIAQLEGKISRKTAESQFESICARVGSHAKPFLKELGGPAALKSLREERNPPEENWWWYLDVLLERQRKLGWRKNGFVLVGIAIGLAIVIGLYRMFLAPDPTTIARYEAEQLARDYMAQGNASEAFVQVEKGLAITPQDPALLTMKGVLLEEQGNLEQAEQVLAQAEKNAESREEFLQMRGQAYMLLNRLDKALEEVTAMLEENPDSVQAYMLSGQVYEIQQEYSRAIDEYGKAYDLADAQDMPQLAAMARVKMATVLQLMNSPQLEMTTQTPVP